MRVGGSTLQNGDFFKTPAFHLHVDERKRMFSNTIVRAGARGGGEVSHHEFTNNNFTFPES